MTKKSTENHSVYLAIIRGLKSQPEYLLLFGILVVCATGSVVGTLAATDPVGRVMALFILLISLAASIIVIRLVLKSKQDVRQLRLTGEIHELNQKVEKEREEIHRLSQRIDRLSEEVGTACKLINMAHYGSLTFSPDQFYDIWKQLMYDTEDKFYAFSYINPDEWTQEYAKRLLSPLKSKIDTDLADIKRLFVIDEVDELQKLGQVIEYHQKYGISVSYIEAQKLYGSNPPICKKPLCFGFILIDNSRLAIFHVDEQRKLKKIEIVLDDVIFAKYEEIYKHAQMLSIPLNLSNVE